LAFRSPVEIVRADVVVVDVFIVGEVVIVDAFMVLEEVADELISGLQPDSMVTKMAINNIMVNIFI
jgi:hypothetical protein